MLMNKLLENIKNNVDLRQSVIELKMTVRDEKSGKALAKMLAGDFSVLTDLLQDKDPKVRKNAALVLGELECEPLREVLWEKYQQEKTLFIRADYLKALSHYDCAPYLDELRARMKFLESVDAASDESKHYSDERIALKTVLRKNEKEGKHKFTGYDNCMEIILLTNRGHRETTAAQIPDASGLRMLAGGIRLHTRRLRKVLPIRTYTELLFPIPDLGMLEGSPGNLARQLVNSRMIPFLLENHEQGGPFYFRLEIKSSMPQERRVDLLKKLAKALEQESGGQLLNAPGGYEVEIRLVANKEGRFVPLLKLFTIHDYRFAYRRETLPTSISPVNAALILELSKDYLMDGAHVLDPFCGVGTMLIERCYQGRTEAMYGVDILEEAVQKARENTALARKNISYINRDFFDFTHKYRFDEIITNLPSAGKTRGGEEISGLYRRFLERVPQMIVKGGIVIAYAADYRLLKEQLRGMTQYRVLEEFCINDREGGYAVVLKYLG